MIARMATRYSGSLKINVVYHDRHGAYRASISRKGKNLWGGWVNPAHASRLAVDSPEAYDAIARSALSFAESDGAGVGDYADVAHGGGPEFWHVRRSEKLVSRSNGARSPSAKKARGATKRASRSNGVRSPSYPYLVVERMTGRVHAGAETRNDAEDMRHDLPTPAADLQTLTREGVRRKFGRISWASVATMRNGYGKRRGRK